MTAVGDPVRFQLFGPRSVLASGQVQPGETLSLDINPHDLPTRLVVTNTQPPVAPAAETVEQPALRQDLENLLNRHSAENESDTPDHVLAEFLTDTLEAFDNAVGLRERWYGRPVGGGQAVLGERTLQGACDTCGEVH